MDFDFEKGGEDCGYYYPPLKNPAQAIVFANYGKSSAYFQYEPGNGTRYEVVFSKHPTRYDLHDQTEQVVMAVICPRNAAMIIPEVMGMYSLGYMKEKLKMLEGDCYALIPLINLYLKENT